MRRQNDSLNAGKTVLPCVSLKIMINLAGPVKTYLIPLPFVKGFKIFLRIFFEFNF